MPTSSRQNGTTTTTQDASPTGPDAPAAPAQQRTDAPTAPRTSTVAPPTAARITTVRPETAAAIDRAATERAEAAAKAERAATERVVTDADPRPAPPPVVAGPRPRASLLATLGLITGVVAALLVLSGPLVGYGIGLAVLALILSLGGVSATGRRHVAGKTDALIGMVLALGAIVVGVLALTGSLSWLGTDTQPVNQVREWLDARFIDAF